MKPLAHRSVHNKDQTVQFQEKLSPDSTVSGVGIDIMEIDRMRWRLDEQPDLVGEIFTDKEVQYCRMGSNPARRFAGCFAAKEAFLKALGTGWQYGISFREVEVSVDEMGSVELKLFGRAAEESVSRKIEQVKSAISFTVDFALATVIVGRKSVKGTK